METSSPLYFRKGRLVLLLVLFALVWSAVPVVGQDKSASPYLFGDWGGARTRLAEEKGVKFDFFYISDLLANPQGGQYKETGWNRVRGTMDIDFSKLANVKGLSLHVTGLWQGGVNLGGGTSATGETYLGSIANPSGLVSARTTRLDSFWLQQDLFNNKFYIRAGQFAGMDFYGVQHYGANYLMEPLDYAFGNLFNTYESFDPAAGPAVEIKIAPVRQFYYRAAFMSGNRDPYGADPTGFNYVKKDSGVFLNEIGYLFDQPGSAKSARKLYPGLYKFGSAYNGGQFIDPFTNTASTGNYLIYFMANQAIFRPTENPNKGLDVHFGVDYSPDHAYNKVDQQFTGGAIYNGLIPKREKDAIAFGFVYSKISGAYRCEFANEGLLAPRLGSEKAIEFNYMAQVTPWLVWQPVVQVYSDLGANPKNGTGVVVGFRTKVTF
jgi:carbohydrate-selective porin OprB